MLALFQEMFSYPFMIRAFFVGSLIALCASLLGVLLVLKHYSMIGDGLSHVGFGALAFANAFHLPMYAVGIPTVIAAAIFLLQLNESKKLKADAAIALVSSASLALGVFVISKSSGMNTDVCNYLFGSILSMSQMDVYISIGITIFILVLFFMFYPSLFAITFDETFAKASGMKVGFFNRLIAVLCALVIVLGMRMMGALLISSFIVFPTLTSVRFAKNFKSLLLSSCVISFVCLWVGLTLSYIYATPTGASIVLCNLVLFLIAVIIDHIKERRHAHIHETY